MSAPCSSGARGDKRFRCLGGLGGLPPRPLPQSNSACSRAQNPKRRSAPRGAREPLGGFAVQLQGAGCGALTGRGGRRLSASPGALLGADRCPGSRRAQPFALSLPNLDAHGHPHPALEKLTLRKFGANKPNGAGLLWVPGVGKAAGANGRQNMVEILTEEEADSLALVRSGQAVQGPRGWGHGTTLKSQFFVSFLSWQQRLTLS